MTGSAKRNERKGIDSISPNLATIKKMTLKKEKKSFSISSPVTAGITSPYKRKLSEIKKENELKRQIFVLPSESIEEPKEPVLPFEPLLQLAVNYRQLTVHYRILMTKTMKLLGAKGGELVKVEKRLTNEGLILRARLEELNQF